MDIGSSVLIGMLGLAGAWIFNTYKSPKEYAGDGFKVLADSVAALTVRLGGLEQAHANLALKYAETHGRLDESVDNLERGVNDLKSAIDKLSNRLEQFSATMGKGHASGRRAQNK